MDVVEEESSAMAMKMTRKSLYELVKQCSNKKIDDKFVFLENHLKNITKCPESEQDKLRHVLKTFKFQFKQKWIGASNKEERFLKKNEHWLNAFITLPTWTTRKTGRPIKGFKESSEQTKRRKTKALREQVPYDQLTCAAQMSQRAAGHSDASKVIKDMTLSPTRAKKYRRSFTSTQKETIKKHTPSQALSIFVEADLTRKQYEVIHAANKNIYPCYSLVKEAKKDCYPREESIRVTETCSEINLQDLLDHTSARLCEYLDDVLESLNDEERSNLELLSKWGCDGSQQRQFKQKFRNSIDSDANIFQSSFVPLQLISNIGNWDVLNRLLLSSDPFLSSTRQRSQKKGKPFSCETLKLLLPVIPETETMEEENESSERESE